ncbi:MAG TPA: DNA-formamidopyrimidine glycosylase [Candidatus Paceibacterota bacterium]|nr:DNA-formamidopyrimidine glycosylase [Candidatus Paceibacterota bacterium]
MPELPEVQTTVDGLNRFVKGLSIKDVWTCYESSYHKGKDNIKDPVFFKRFKSLVVGQKILRARRRAKNILIDLSNNHSILVHMKMTGHILYGTYVQNKKKEWEPETKEGPLRDPFNKHIRLLFTLSNGKHLALSDMRKFAKVTVLSQLEAEKTLHLKDIGPEPLEENFSLQDFKERLLLRQNGKVKQVLMDPKVVAGIGNIYSDEMLWRAGIHPERRVKDISKSEFGILYKAMKATLLRGIDFGGDSMSDYRNLLGERGKFQEKHEAYRRTSQKCRKSGCKGVIRRKKVGGRSAHFCDTHQK